ncbi:efflux RND transporter periplasmic adaptor subunit [Undibacterium sp.]|jgi:cobalt-zinc-cadmium efflux system membrane fusion protein|uniref:efflux RND transporter periplasmic adaptor subunit n=1 Tax=Undibacterium sp. TaxID=1914977 RepID=UPI002C216694|nr:efflux RND transporter periplasmic adaptor subunit [Undibacterium sp.]HTD02229.1 efflux RND transporter periplasmic adaptor subunit [Undibacterium sp.]
MSSSSNLVKTAVAAALIGAAALGIRHVYATQEAKPVSAAKDRPQPGIVKFALNSAQLSSLKISAIEEIPLPVSDMVNGRITYDENVTSRISSPILGRVIALHTEIGEKVRRGAVLADIDSPDLSTADADWRKAQADELKKKLAYDRAKILFDGDVLARKDYESAEADYMQSRAETRRAQLRMKNLNASGNEDGRFGLRSPIAGIVADKQINPGLEVRPDLPNPLFTVTDLSRLWVIVDVPEQSAAQIHAGQIVSIETDAYPDQRFNGKVALVGLALDPVTRRIQVRCAVKNDDGRLKPEMFARISFLADDSAKKAAQIPNTSIFVEGAYNYVFVETQPGTFERRRINVKIKGYEKSFVDTGLANGEKIVTEGAFLLNAEAAGNAR